MYLFISIVCLLLDIFWYPINVKWQKSALLYLMWYLPWPQSPKFKRVSLNKNSKVPFLGSFHLCRFWLKRFEKMENIKKLNKIIFHNTNIDIHKTALPHSWNPGSKTGFHNNTLSKVLGSGKVLCILHTNM